MVQLSYPYMTTGKTIALTRWTFVDKEMSLLFNTLSRFVIAFLPRIKRLNFMAAVTVCSDFGAQKIKSDTVSTVSPYEFQRIARRDKKAFFSNQCKEIEENNRMEKIGDLFKKIEIPREHFMQRWA